MKQKLLSNLKFSTLTSKPSLILSLLVLTFIIVASSLFPDPILAQEIRPRTALPEEECQAFLFFKDDESGAEFDDETTLPLTIAQGVNIVSWVQPSCPNGNRVRVTMVRHAGGSSTETVIIPNVPYDGEYHIYPGTSAFTQTGEYEFFADMRRIDPDDPQYDPNDVDWQEILSLSITVEEGPHGIDDPPVPGNQGPGNQTIGNQNLNSGQRAPDRPPRGIMQFRRPLTGTFSDLLSRIITVLLGLVAGISLIFIIIGGFRLVFSQGNADAVKTAKGTITWAVAGLVVALLAFTLIRLVEQILY